MKLGIRLIICCAAVCLSACGAKKTKTSEEYLSKASDHFRHGAYGAAAEQYRELLDQYPFSEHSEDAEFNIAHAQFLNDSCPEAVAAFSDFQRRHPTSPYLPMAGYLIGQCYEKQMRPPDRDQTAAQNAHAYYVAVTQQYPESPYADLSRDRLLYCRASIAQHEMLVAGFYLHRKNRKAAEIRLLDLVNEFNDTDVAGNALYNLGELYEEMGSDDRALLAFESVTYHHPDSVDARKAERAISKLPQESRPSGDPLALLAAESGRQRRIAMANITDVQERTASGGNPTAAAPPRPGFGFPTGGGDQGPFGQSY